MFMSLLTAWADNSRVKWWRHAHLRGYTRGHLPSLYFWPPPPSVAVIGQRKTASRAAGQINVQLHLHSENSRSLWQTRWALFLCLNIYSWSTLDRPYASGALVPVYSLKDWMTSGIFVGRCPLYSLQSYLLLHCIAYAHKNTKWIWFYCAGEYYDQRSHTNFIVFWDIALFPCTSFILALLNSTICLWLVVLKFSIGVRVYDFGF